MPSKAVLARVCSCGNAAGTTPADCHQDGVLAQGWPSQRVCVDQRCDHAGTRVHVAKTQGLLAGLHNGWSGWCSGRPLPSPAFLQPGRVVNCFPFLGPGQGHTLPRHDGWIPAVAKLCTQLGLGTKFEFSLVHVVGVRDLRSGSYAQ